MIEVVRADARHVDGWARLRAMLWAEETVSDHRAVIEDERGREGRVAFVAVTGEDVIGVVEAALRHDHVNGCETSPVAFLEGLIVSPAWRRRGVAQALVRAVEDWGRAHRCTELASDAEDANLSGQAAHRALGFEERERVVFYRKRLAVPNGSTPS